MLVPVAPRAPAQMATWREGLPPAWMAALEAAEKALNDGNDGFSHDIDDFTLSHSGGTIKYRRTGSNERADDLGGEMDKVAFDRSVKMGGFPDSEVYTERGVSGHQTTRSPQSLGT